jgi:hypothetical protein
MEIHDLRLRREIIQRIDDVFEANAGILERRVHVGPIFAGAVFREPTG